MEDETTISREIEEAFKKHSIVASADRTLVKPQKYRPKRKGRYAGTFPRNASSGFVYVAVCAESWVKIGVTADLDHRAREIGAKMVWWRPVTREASLKVEAETLRLCGRNLDVPGEWVRVPVTTAIDAANEAIATISRFMRVNPHISEENARMARISLAISLEMPQELRRITASI